MEKEENKRISFDIHSAYMLYEWYEAINSVNPFLCKCCPPIAKRLGEFIGDKEVRQIRKNVKEHPYARPLKKSK